LSNLSSEVVAKCHFPVLAKRYVVRNGEVLHADLSSPDPIDE
jgi:hypothetical protein